MTVAPGDDVAHELDLRAAVPVAHTRALGLELVQAHVLGLEHERPTRLEPRRDQVLHHLLLPVDRDVLAGQAAEVDPVPGAAELELEPVVGEALLAESSSDAHLLEQLDRPVLEDAGADPPLDVLAAARLQYDRVDPLHVEEVRQDEPRRAGADDPDLRALGAAHARSSSASTSCAIANAELAAGTPQ